MEYQTLNTNNKCTMQDYCLFFPSLSFPFLKLFYILNFDKFTSYPQKGHLQNKLSCPKSVEVSATGATGAAGAIL